MKENSIMDYPYVSITVRGFTGKGWELQCIGPKKWAEETIIKFIPIIQKITKGIP
jgi:hypothetical protein